MWEKVRKYVCGRTTQRKREGKQRWLFNFFSVGFPGRSIWTDHPHVTLVLCGCWWVCVLPAATVQAGHAAPCCSSGWEAGGTTVCRIARSWPGNFIIKARQLSKKKLSCFVGWIPRASAAAWGAKTPSFYSPVNPPVSIFLWKSGLLVNHTLISVFYSLGAQAY